MEKFSSSIKKKYHERLINQQEQWPFRHGEKLIRLELVKRKRGECYIDEREEHHSQAAQRQSTKYYRNLQHSQRKEDIERIPMSYSDLFKPDTGPGVRKRIRRVLVEGDAGIGKTTLCTSISEDWANEKLFQEFSLLLLIPLYEKKVASATSLSELLALLHSSSNLRTLIANFIEEEEGENVLIVADGWDELRETERHDHSFLYKLFFGNLFPFLTVLLTSRPSASASLHRLSCIDRFVVICGFNKYNVKEYIELEFADHSAKSDRLLEQLKNNPLIGSICSIPLNCAIICHLWRTLEETLPITMTELYTKIILNILFRNVRKWYSSLEGLTNFDDLPGDLSKSWWLLCEFAFLTLTKDSIVFSQEELHCFFLQDIEMDKNIPCFGLIQYTKPILDTGYGTSFHFLHLTFQEYLAALHFAKQSLASQYESLFVMKSQRFSMVWRFSFGILFRKPLTMAVGPMLDVDIVVDYLTQVTELSYMMLCHCAFEANYGPVTHKIVQYLQDFSIPSPHSAHDCEAVLYLLSHSDNRDKILNQVRFENCVNSKLIIKFADILANKYGLLQISSMKVCGGQLTDSDICHLFNKGDISFLSLGYLELNGNELTTASFLSMTYYCSYDLFHLDLSYNPLGVSGLQNLESAICSDRLVSLHQLAIQQTLTSDQDINSALLTSLCSAISRHCLHFNDLDLSHNNLGVPGAQAIGVALHQLATQGKYFALKLNDTELHNEGISMLIHSLNHPCYLSCLLMCSNSIGTGGIMQLAEGISSGKLYITGDESPYFKDLDLSDNPLCLEQILNLLVAASHSCSVRRLTLSKCWLTNCPRCFSTIEISEDVYATITCLYLDDNHFSGDNVHILVCFMLLCRNLIFLSCCQCGITSKDLKHLLSLFSSSEHKQSLAIHRWWLNDNELNDKGILDLIEYLPLFQHSPEIDISGNPVSSDMQESLQGALVSLKVIILC